MSQVLVVGVILGTVAVTGILFGRNSDWSASRDAAKNLIAGFKFMPKAQAARSTASTTEEH